MRARSINGFLYKFICACGFANVCALELVSNLCVDAPPRGGSVRQLRITLRGFVAPPPAYMNFISPDLMQNIILAVLAATVLPPLSFPKTSQGFVP